MISVIICVYNRSESIKALLECLLIQEAPEGRFPYEIIVVDNNSVDNTKEAVESYILKFSGKLRYLFEPRQGKSFALNLGISEAKGDILAFLDDDCTVGRDYVSRVNKIFQEHGDIDFIGGKILPRWVGGECPSWLSKVVLDNTAYEPTDELYWKRIFFRGPLAFLDYGEKAFPLDNTHQQYKSFLFYGPNMAVKKSAFDKVGGYAPEKTITQDTDICLRLIRAGMKGLYTPDIIVYHGVKVDNLTSEFYCQWYFKRGKFLEMNEAVQRKFYHPLGIQNAVIFKTCGLFLKSIFTKFTLDKVYYRCQALFNTAQILRTAKKNF